MDQKTHEIRLAQWKSIVKECKDSGLPVVVWCRENNVCAKKFYYWQPQLRASLSGKTTPDAPNYQLFCLYVETLIVLIWLSQG